MTPVKRPAPSTPVEPAQDQQRIRLDLEDNVLESETIAISVGNRWFYIHRSLLLSQSQRFCAFWRQQITLMELHPRPHIQILTITPDTFQLLAQFLYRWPLELPPRDQRRPKALFPVYVDLWMTANRLGLPRLQNQAMNLLFSLQFRFATTYLPEPAIISQVFTCDKHRHVQLRKLIVDIFVWTSSDQLPSLEDISLYPKAFLELCFLTKRARDCGIPEQTLAARGWLSRTSQYLIDEKDIQRSLVEDVDVDVISEDLMKRFPQIKLKGPEKSQA